MHILHTADWHIGQKLHERQRIDEHEKFLEWLLKTIIEKNVELLLVSGDIFDTSLPSADATKLYYRFLHQLYTETETHTIIIAGNHDSPRHLEAPREFLKMGRIHVVGLANEPSECVINIPPDKPRVSIAAVPFLSENELPHVSYESEIEKSERYRERLKTFYAECVSHMPDNLPKILMGHLFVHGGKETKSERNIQIGGATAIRVSDFPDDVDYVALGHLHRPQSLNNDNYPIHYSGSPIPMRFNETKYRKKVYLLEISDKEELTLTEEIEIPIFKELCIITGDENEVKMQALSENWDGKYIQVKLTLDAVAIGINDEIRSIFAERGGDVLSVEIDLPQAKETHKIQIEDMKQPTDVFKQFFQEKLSKEPDESMLQTFKELIQLVEETQ